MKNGLSAKQGTALLIMSLLGARLIVNGSIMAGSYSYVAAAVAVLLAIPVYAMYSRIIALRPGTDLAGLSCECFGSRAGKAAGWLYTAFLAAIAGFFVWQLASFIHIVSLTKTSEYAIVALVMLTVVIAACKGIKNIGYIAVTVMVISFVFLAIIVAMSLSKGDFLNIDLRPPQDAKRLFSASACVLAFPFLEGGMFLSVFNDLDDPLSAKKCYRRGLITAGTVFVALTFIILLVLGTPMQEIMYFPFFSAMSVGVDSEYIAHVEVTAALIALIFIVIKAAVSLAAAANGMCALTGKKEKTTVFTVVLGVIAGIVAAFAFGTGDEIDKWITYYSYAAALFFGVLPLIMLIILAVKARRQARLSS